MTLKKATIADIDKIKELSSLWNDDGIPVDTDILESYLEYEIVFCSVEDDEIIGIMILEKNLDESLHVARFFVHPDERDNGLGSELMDNLVNLLDQTCTQSFLSVSRNNPAVDLYERYGYKETSIFKPPSSNYIAMTRVPN